MVQNVEMGIKGKWGGWLGLYATDTSCIFLEGKYSEFISVN